MIFFVTCDQREMFSSFRRILSRCAPTWSNHTKFSLTRNKRSSSFSSRFLIWNPIDHVPGGVPARKEKSARSATCANFPPDNSKILSRRERVLITRIHIAGVHEPHAVWTLNVVFTVGTGGKKEMRAVGSCAFGRWRSGLSRTRVKFSLCHDAYATGRSCRGVYARADKNARRIERSWNWAPVDPWARGKRARNKKARARNRTASTKRFACQSIGEKESARKRCETRSRAAKTRRGDCQRERCDADRETIPGCGEVTKWNLEEGRPIRNMRTTYVSTNRSICSSKIYRTACGKGSWQWVKQHSPSDQCNYTIKRIQLCYYG